MAKLLNAERLAEALQNKNYGIFLDVITHGAYQSEKKEWKEEFDLRKCEALNVEFKALEHDLNCEAEEFVKDVLGMYHACPEGYFIFGLDEKSTSSKSLDGGLHVAQKRLELSKPLTTLFPDGVPSKEFKSIFLGIANALPKLTYQELDVDGFKFGVLTVTQLDFTIHLVKEINRMLTPQTIPLRVLNVDGPSIVAVDTRSSHYKTMQHAIMKSEEATLVSPVMEALQDSNVFVIWMRCPWAGHIAQEFPDEHRLRPDLILDFAEDKWATEEVPKDTHGYIQGPDALYEAFKQYYEYVEISKVKKAEHMWISAKVPLDRNKFSSSETAQHWRKHHSNVLEHALQSIPKQKQVVLLVTAFGNDSWTKACVTQLFPDILNGWLGRRTLQSFVLTSLPQENTYNRVPFTWINCSPKIFITQSRYMKFVMPPLGDLKVMVNGALQVLTTEQQVRLQNFDIIAVDPLTCKLVNSNTVEDPDMRYLRGGRWSWHDVILMVQSKQFHKQCYDKAIQFLKNPAECRQILLRIIHKHNEGGTSMAVQLCYELAKLHPVVSLKQGYQPSSSDMEAISRVVNDLSLQLKSPIVVFLGDLELDLIKLLPQAYSNHAIAYIACNALPWNSPHLATEKTKQTNYLLHIDIPTDRTLDSDRFKELYLTKAKQYHKTHDTKITATSPTSYSPTVFDYSFCAFVGTHLTAEQYTSQFFSRANEPIKKLLVWIAICQLFSQFEFNSTWLNDELTQKTLQSLQEHPLLCTTNDTTIFCHKQIAKYIMDTALANTSVFDSLKEFLQLIPDHMLAQIVRRDTGKFSSFITEMRKCEATLLDQLINLVDDANAFLSSDTKCHILIVISRLLLKAKHTGRETSTETAHNFAMRAYEEVEYENDDYNTDKAIALAHIAHVHKVRQDWELASNYFRKSLQLQNLRHGALLGLIYSNCQQIPQTGNRNLWIEAVDAFYLLSVGAPFRCHEIRDQLEILCQYQCERDVGEDNLQIAFLELLTILDAPVEALTKEDLYNSHKMSDSLKLGLYLKCPSFQDLQIATPTFNKRRDKFQPFSDIEVECETDLYPKWLLSASGWMPIHNRKYWYPKKKMYEKYTIQPTEFEALIEGASIYEGEFNASKKRVFLSKSTTAYDSESGDYLKIGMTVGSPQDGDSVLCCVGLCQDHTSSRHSIIVWIISNTTTA